MTSNNDSIIYSSIRAFFKGFFGVIGFFIALTLGLIILLAVFASSAVSSSGDLSQTTSTKILPDANGVRTSSSTAPIILELKIDGVIGLEELTMDKVRTALQESQEGNFKGRVKGLMLYINSPGGTVTDADGIYRAIKEYKERYHVPVIAYTEGLCASGGMYIACAADKIYAADTTLIGSVGVIIPTFLNFSKVLDKVGVDTLTISAGKGKDEMNPLRPWKPDEDASYKEICAELYGHFVSIVTSNRPEMSKEKLVKEYGAHVFLAQEAHQKGYIDGINGNESDVLKALAHAAGIEGETYQVVELKLESLLAQLLKGQSSVFSGKIKHEININGSLDSALTGKILYLYRPE